MTRDEAPRSDTSDVLHPVASLTLFGFAPTDATVSVVARSRAWRIARVARSLLLTAVITPVAFLIPPHAPWGAGALGAGLVLTSRRWLERYTLRHAVGACPKCGEAIIVQRVQRLRHPHTVACDGCHHEPTLRIRLHDGAGR